MPKFKAKRFTEREYKKFRPDCCEDEDKLVLAALDEYDKYWMYDINKMDIEDCDKATEVINALRKALNKAIKKLELAKKEIENDVYKDKEEGFESYLEVLSDRTKLVNNRKEKCEEKLKEKPKEKPKRLGLHDILKNPSYYKEFRKHATQGSEIPESIGFFEALGYPGKMKMKVTDGKKAKKIYEEYVSPDTAKIEINMQGDVRQSLLEVVLEDVLEELQELYPDDKYLESFKIEANKSKSQLKDLCLKYPTAEGLSEESKYYEGMDFSKCDSNVRQNISYSFGQFQKTNEYKDLCRLAVIERSGPGLSEMSRELNEMRKRR